MHTSLVLSQCTVEAVRALLRSTARPVVTEGEVGADSDESSRQRAPGGPRGLIGPEHGEWGAGGGTGRAASSDMRAGAGPLRRVSESTPSESLDPALPGGGSLDWGSPSSPSGPAASAALPAPPSYTGRA